MSADWDKIKTEYITTDISYRKLAQKYGVGTSTLYARAGKEKWVELKEQHRSRTVANALEQISAQQSARMVRLMNVTDKLLAKAEQFLDSSEMVGAQSLRNVAAALKDTKEVYGVQSDADMREQEARIAKLNREAQDEDKSKNITVTLEGDLSRYAK